MLFLVLQLGEERYAIEAGDIVEIVPFLRLRALPQAPPYVAGVFDYRGELVPVIDMQALVRGEPSRPLMTTRIVVVRYVDEQVGERRLGLLTEEVVETLRRDPGEFQPAGIEVGEAPYLGPMTRDAQGLVQQIRIEQLLPAPVRRQLFPEAAS
ncbi:chemotaxis protein CheW [Thiohalobacter sp.]|uniref:chemotaxis protein CheW n=1 Tax=Thiohalobacter sp. TaxID=2025948 RepID=UPI00261B5CCC|nr:chemotaxis protein CheW [Thiohalobacter sp.]